jgi:hypothetical protein
VTEGKSIGADSTRIAGASQRLREAELEDQEWRGYTAHAQGREKFRDLEEITAWPND